ncbi:hypothetical protein F4805DRAFT_458411 [Annulohypoxylon moriforme]|nr:hypothetical protein F4805DRAFT_458411 [Annulohypoxylon moriforme]
MTDNHREHRPSRSAPNRAHRSSRTRPQRRRRPAEPNVTPSVAGDEVAGFMEHRTSSGKRSNDDPAYAQSSVDMTETSTYRNGIRPTSTTAANPSLSASTTTSQGGDDANAMSYDSISNDDSYPLDGSSGYSQFPSSYPTADGAVISPTWSGFYPTYSSSDDYVATITTTMSSGTVSYTQSDTRFDSYGAPTTSSPHRMEVIDEDSIPQVTGGAYSQDPNPHTQTSPDPYFSPLGRRWSTENHHGSIASDSSEQAIHGIIRRQSEGEQDLAMHEQLRENNINEYISSPEPWSTQHRHSEGHAPDELDSQRSFWNYGDSDNRTN